MNNDVEGKLNNNFDAKNNVSNAIEKRAAQKTTNSIKSREFINKNVDKSIENFLNNPDFAQAHVDFCDSLVEHGYCLEDAIKKTDTVFEILHQKETY